MMKAKRGTVALAAVAAAVAGCADGYGYGAAPDWYGPQAYHGDYDYQGRDYDYGDADQSQNPFRGAGAPLLDPWLALTPEGRQVIAMGFRSRDGVISEEVADRANIWFRRYADTNRDLALTDEEIRIGLAQASQSPEKRGY